MTKLRPAWVEIDLDALAGNARLMREMAGPDCFLWTVVKGDGYGTGDAEAAVVLQAQGADGIALGDADAVPGLRAVGVTLPILLYAGTLPQDAAAVAALGVIPTLHDMAGLRAFAALKRPLDVQVKLDCGVGRIGFLPHQWDEAFALLAATPALKVTGIYSHFRTPEDQPAIDRQAALFAAGLAAARAAGLDGFRAMASGSRMVVGRPDMNLTAINPGKALYGYVDSSWPQHDRLRPVVAALKARVIQVKDYPAGSYLYGEDGPILAPRRTAVVPLGYMDGLNFFPPAHQALLHGHRVPVLGKRGIEHMVLDVTSLPEVAVGDEVVFLGAQGEERITADELAAVLGMQPMEVASRIASMAPRRYLPVLQPALEPAD
jgi:alanine racemase